jgi:hypothetical protein
MKHKLLYIRAGRRCVSAERVTNNVPHGWAGAVMFAVLVLFGAGQIFNPAPGLVSQPFRRFGGAAAAGRRRSYLSSNFTAYCMM